MKPFRLLGRSLQAIVGLVIFSFGVYINIQASIGLSPWDCLSMGLSYQLPISYGQAAILISVLILIIDLLLHEQIGIGTILDALICGAAVDQMMAMQIVPEQTTLISGILLLTLGMFIMSFGQYLYMKAGLCCGPRDSLLVGIGKRLSRTPIGAVNVLLLVCALFGGWLLGGEVGIGSLIASLGIGIAMQITFKLLHFEPRDVVHESLLSSLSLKRPRSESSSINP